jgi:hypothetical protein
MTFVSHFQVSLLAILFFLFFPVPLRSESTDLNQDGKISSMDLLILLQDWYKEPSPTPTPIEDLNAAYQAAIADASVAEASETTRDLTALIDSEPGLIWDTSTGPSRVLMVMWTSWPGYADEVGSVTTVNRNLWVSAAPQIQEFCKAQRLTEDNVVLRLEQLNGMPAGRNLPYFVEFWVNPGDLYRPSADPEVSDHEAGIDYPVSTTYVSLSQEFRDWFEWQRAHYGTSGYPWTRLGYTYDWGNPNSEVGLSEYVTRKKAPLGVKRVVGTLEYCLGKTSKGVMPPPAQPPWRHPFEESRP